MLFYEVKKNGLFLDVFAEEGHQIELENPKKQDARVLDVEALLQPGFGDADNRLATDLQPDHAFVDGLYVLEEGAEPAFVDLPVAYFYE